MDFGEVLGKAWKILWKYSCFVARQRNSHDLYSIGLDVDLSASDQTETC